MDGSIALHYEFKLVAFRAIPVVKSLVDLFFVTYNGLVFLFLLFSAYGCVKL